MKKVSELNKGQKKVMFEMLDSQVKKGFHKYFTDLEKLNYMYLKNNLK